ncbi:MAG: hypothetical protein ACRDFB_10690, partial [Rhabdochlamydiaceae bacterium]
MVTRVSNLLGQRVIPLLDLPVALLVIKTVQTTVNGIFASYKESRRRTFLTLAASAIVVPILRPFTYYTVAVLVVVNTVMMVLKIVLNQKTSLVPLPRGLKVLLQKSLERQMSLSYPVPINSLLNQIHPGKLISFKASDGWDLNFFTWALSQKSSLVGYPIYEFSDDTENGITELQHYINKNPKSIIITTKKLQQHLIIPKQSYLIDFFPADDPSSNPVSLTSLSEKETVDLFKTWVQSPEYLKEAGLIRFEDSSIQCIYNLAQKDKTKSVYHWIKVILRVVNQKAEVKITRSLTVSDQLVISPYSHTWNTESFLTVAASLRECGLNIFYCPAANINKPSYLVQIPQQPSRSWYISQAQQLNSSLRGKDTPHALVVELSSREIETILSMPSMQDASKVFIFKAGSVLN